MCARYTLFATPDQIACLFDVEAPREVQPRYNIAPSATVPTVAQLPGQDRSLMMAVWGLVPVWAGAEARGFINARAESASEKPAFRAAMKRRRILIPSTGFYEWRTENGRKQPYFIAMNDGGLFAFAGVWEPRDGLPTCAILTTSANEVVEPIHDRMPVIVDRGDFELWLDPKVTDAAKLAHLLRPFAAERMHAYAVDRRVGNPWFDDPTAIAPIG